MKGLLTHSISFSNGSHQILPYGDQLAEVIIAI